MSHAWIVIITVLRLVRRYVLRVVLNFFLLYTCSSWNAARHESAQSSTGKTSGARLTSQRDLKYYHHRRPARGDLQSTTNATIEICDTSSHYILYACIIIIAFSPEITYYNISITRSPYLSRTSRHIAWSIRNISHYRWTRPQTPRSCQLDINYVSKTIHNIQAIIVLYIIIWSLLSRSHSAARINYIL